MPIASVRCFDRIRHALDHCLRTHAGFPGRSSTATPTVETPVVKGLCCHEASSSAELRTWPEGTVPASGVVPALKTEQQHIYLALHVRVSRHGMSNPPASAWRTSAGAARPPNGSRAHGASKHASETKISKTTQTTGRPFFQAASGQPALHLGEAMLGSRPSGQGELCYGLGRGHYKQSAGSLGSIR